MSNKIGFQKGHPTYAGVEKGWFKKGLRPWNLGMSKKIGKSCKGCKKTILVSPNRINRTKWCSNRCKIIYSPFSTFKKKCTQCDSLIQKRSKLCKRCANLGNLSPSWKGGVTPINIKIRMSADYRKWRESVLLKDNFRCRICNSSKNLEADHIKAFSQFPKLRLDINNGRTLCADCHKLTPNYGYKARYQTK